MAQLIDYAFPLELDEAGDLKLCSGAECVKGYIHSFLLTYKGERLGLLDYGLDVYMFEAYNNFGFIAADLQKKLSSTIPIAEFACTAELDDEGNGQITVFWSYDSEAQEPISFVVEE